MTNKIHCERDSSTRPFRYEHWRAVSLLFLFCTLSLFACSGEAASMAESAPTAEASRDMATYAYSEPAPTRKLVHNAELSLEVEAYANARAAIDKELNEVGGFVRDANVQHRNGRVSSARLILSIPKGSLLATLHTYGELGTVLHETISTEDVTVQHIDITARLKNARVLESRLLGLIKGRTEKLKDVLDLEQALSRVRQTIEILDGKLRSLDSQVAFSTLTLQITSREFFTASASQSLGDEVGTAFSRSLHAMVRFGRALLVLSAALLPWALPLGLFLWLWVRWLNHRSKRRRIPVVASSS